MGKYTDTWANRQYVTDPERLSRHARSAEDVRRGHEGFSEVDLQATAPESALSGEVITDAQVDGGNTPAIDQTPSFGGRGRKWTRLDSAGPEGVAQRTGPIDLGVGAWLFDRAQEIVMMVQAAARGRDYGAGTASTKVFMPHGPHGQMYDEERPFVTTEGYLTTPMATTDPGDAHAVLRRGLNADPINDGDVGRPLSWKVDQVPSFRPARYVHTPLQRSFKPTRQMPTDQVQINPAHTPQVIVDIPTPSVSSKGGTLFSSLQKFVPKAVPIGGLNRTPSPWYESAVATAEPDNPGRLPDYSGPYVVN